jgi:hypothetical protein
MLGEIRSATFPINSLIRRESFLPETSNKERDPRITYPSLGGQYCKRRGYRKKGKM